MLHLDRVHRLRLLMRRLSLVISLVTGLSIPLGYAIASWVHHQNRLTTLASLTADRLATYADLNGAAWRHDQERLSELIRLNRQLDNEIHETVRDAGGDPIVSRGQAAPGPALRRSAPVIVRDQVVGRIDLETSLRPMLLNITLFGVLGALVGGVAYAAMNGLPMRALNRTLDELQVALDKVEAHADETSRAYEELQRQHRLIEETTQELMRARDAARAADRTKSAFLAAMSHEFRTPLNAIIGFSDMLRSEMFGPLGNDRYRTYSADILDSGRHLLAVINDVLDMSKIEAGQLQLHFESVDLGTILDGCARLMCGRIEAAGIRLDMPAASPLPTLRADPVKIKQIVLNILSNAVKFTPRGGRVRLTVTTESPETMAIRIIDSGIGMTERDIRLALQPFQQVDNTMTRRHSGTGLGLPLAKALAEHHGGSLSIQSEPGVGTAVTVCLPIARPTLMAAKPEDDAA